MNQRPNSAAPLASAAGPATAGSDRNVRRIVCVDFQRWKHGYLRSFLASPGIEVTFVRGLASAAHTLAPRDALVLWGASDKHDPYVELCAREGVPLWRMEDGFLRSVGLGSDLEEPLSLVVDTRGIYFDPSRVSDLEHILATREFEPEELRRARALRETIVRLGVSKYNIGVRQRVGPRGTARTVALVVGQVEGDASIERGTVDVRDNEALLRAARIARPHAHLIYKPHPDVVRGHRHDSLGRELARRLCDEVVEHASLRDCLAAADEVHTMTSLVGFEALLRGMAVATYGQPFYSGWGLTSDRHPHPRRARRLTLDELVAGTLVRYPRYLDPETGRLTTAEATVSKLVAERGAVAARRLSPIARLAKRARNIAEGALRRVR